MALSSLPLDQLIGRGRSSEVFRYGPDHVLKLYKKPFEPAAVANEFQAARQAYAFGLSTPEPIRILERDGRTGIVFEAVHSENLLRSHKRRPLAFLTALERMAQLHCAINAQSGSDLPSQHEILRLQIMHGRASDTVKQAALCALQSLPAGNRFCHGDLHPENVLSTAHGLCVVDWQKATRGNPAGDIARTALLIRYGSLNIGRIGRYLPLGTIRSALAWHYVGRCCQLSGVPRSEVLAWRLPLLAARLFGQVAASEDEVRAEAEQLVHRTGADEHFSCEAPPARLLRERRKDQTSSDWTDRLASGCCRS